jgi:hypothetical protein
MKNRGSRNFHGIFKNTQLLQAILNENFCVFQIRSTGSPIIRNKITPEDNMWAKLQ